MTIASASPSAVAGGERLYGLPPIVSQHTRLLVLGSFPGERSLALRRYYAHPQNHFWKILSALWSLDLMVLDEAARHRALLEHGLGVWDVYAACDRVGSLDSAIRNPRVNDFGALAAACPQLQAVAHNGAQSHRHAGEVVAALHAGTGRSDWPVYRLPSTSPANASWSLARKLEVWREVLVRHGVAGGEPAHPTPSPHQPGPRADDASA